MTYVLIFIVVGAFCLLLLLGLIVAARQRPTRHEQALEHIDELEKELGMGQADQLNSAGPGTPAPDRIEDAHARIRRPGERS